MNLINKNYPKDLKFMTIDELELLAIEIREFLINSVSLTGGHLASNLGTVELSIALHCYFNTPTDKIIWDVGHQSYVHKILTNRADEFKTLRKFDGMSGFPKSADSIYDAFDTGHSSTSISLAAGFAKARDINKENHQIISVIGDGSLTGGLAYEGLNNLSEIKSKAIVILNDNGMSIGKNTGGLSKHLSKIRVSKGYKSLKKSISTSLKKVPFLGNSIYNQAYKLRDSIKYTLVDGIIFEELGFTYLGPIDGHDIKSLLKHLALADTAKEPVLLHVITQKGKGYKNAVQNPDKFHGIGPFDIETGQLKKQSTAKSYSKIFGDKLLELAKKDPKIVAISAAMVDGTGLKEFQKQLPSKLFDVGIAEGHAVTFAGGLAKNGIKPVVALYSTFLQRAYDQIVIDVCLQNLPVIFAIDRAGVVGEDGETHHGILDISFLKSIPNLTILAPKDGKELENMLEYAFTLNSPVAIRYPRGEAKNIPMKLETPINEGAEIIKSGSEISIWALGKMVNIGLEVIDLLKKDNIDAELINARFAEPVDNNMLQETLKRADMIITLEDNIKVGGFGESISKMVSENNTSCKIINIGWEKEFIVHGNTDILFNHYNLDAQSIYERIKEEI